MSGLLLAVDPGIRGCGVALFKDSALIACAYAKNPVKSGSDFDAVISLAKEVYGWWNERLFDFYRGGELDLRLVLEWPRVYTASKSKGDNNDLMPLVAVDAAVVALFGVPARRVYPRDWKSTLSKEQTQARVESRLRPMGGGSGEWSAYCEGTDAARSLAHNVVDAVGIGLHALGRFEPVKVIHR